MYAQSANTVHGRPGATLAPQPLSQPICALSSPIHPASRQQWGTLSPADVSNSLIILELTSIIHLKTNSERNLPALKTQEM